MHHQGPTYSECGGEKNGSSPSRLSAIEREVLAQIEEAESRLASSIAARLKRNAAEMETARFAVDFGKSPSPSPRKAPAQNIASSRRFGSARTPPSTPASANRAVATSQLLGLNAAQLAQLAAEAKRAAERAALAALAAAKAANCSEMPLLRTPPTGHD
eukprot:4471063-Pleurochrysis_carterae.AAC.2